MACSKNGLTVINTCIPVPGATATDATYALDLTHYLCGNRKVCASSAFPISANLSYQVQDVKAIGNDTYQCDIFVSGQVSYKPYRNGSGYCGCDDNCYRTDNVWTTLSVPVTTNTIPTITAGTCQCSPTNLGDCCSVTNAVSIVTSFNVASA